MFTPKKYIPDAFARDVTKIDYEHLWDLGIRAILFDLDLTLALYKEERLRDDTVEFLNRLRARGFRLCFVTNTILPHRTRRARALASQAGVECVPLGIFKKKPNRYGIDEAMRKLKSSPEETAVIGDDVSRDILAAKRAGVRWTVLVLPKGWHPWWEYTVFLVHRLRDVMVRRKCHHRPSLPRKTPPKT